VSSSSEESDAACDDQNQAGSSTTRVHVRVPVQLVAASSQLATRASKGITKPKEYKDGTVRWILSAAIEEPSNLDDALANKNWKEAMDAEYDALMVNQSWRLVPQQSGTLMLLIVVGSTR
jgi:hypothetical protein